MRIFKSKVFNKFARKEKISDAQLQKAINDINSGLIDADLGGGVIKQRIARNNEGKSGGYRSIILFRKEERAFFVYCFAKNDASNIDATLEADYKDLAKLLFSLSDEKIATLLDTNKFIEVEYNGKS